MTSSLFRSAKQIEISQCIKRIANADDLYEILRLLSDGLHLSSPQHFISNAFLLTRSKFSDESIDNVLISCHSCKDNQTKQRSISPYNNINGVDSATESDTDSDESQSDIDSSNHDSISMNFGKLNDNETGTKTNRNTNKNTIAKECTSGKEIKIVFDRKKGLVKRKKHLKKCRLQYLPKDIFNRIGSFLKIKSSLRLSLTNYEFYKFVQNSNYFDQLSKQTYKLELNEEKLKIIYENNCNLGCFTKCEQLFIATGPSRPTGQSWMVSSDYGESHTSSGRNNGKDKHILCTTRIFNTLSTGDASTSSNNRVDDENQCILYKIINKIETSDDAHELLWFKRLLSNMQKFFLSNYWSCAYEHLPMQWIFDRDRNRDSDRIKSRNGTGSRGINSTSISTSIGRIIRHSSSNGSSSGSGGSNRKSERKRHSCSRKKLTVIASCNSSFDAQCLNEDSAIRFSEKYDYYFSNICNNDASKIRQIKRIWFPQKEFDIFNTLPKLHHNFDGFVLYFPRIDKSKNRFETLKQFFESFHEKVCWLEAHFTMEKIKESIVTQWFKSPTIKVETNDNLVDFNFNNSAAHIGYGVVDDVGQDQQSDKEMEDDDEDEDAEEEDIHNLLVDLDKTEDILSFESFLEIYDCQDKILPHIRILNIDFDNNEYCPTLSLLLKHDKIMKLLNIGNTVCKLSFLFFTADHVSNVEACVIELIGKLKNLATIDLIIRIKNSFEIRKVENFYNSTFFVNLLMKCSLSCKISKLNVLFGDEGCLASHNRIGKIKIDNKEQLLYKNRDRLRNTMINQAEESWKRIKQAWNTRDSFRRYKGRYNRDLLKESFHFERTFDV